MQGCYVRRLTPEGLEPVGYTARSLSDAARYEPDDGVYTVTNTYNIDQVLKFEAHLNRLEDSARRANIPLKLDRAALRAALRQMIGESGFGDVRFRITAPRDRPDTLILSMEPFTPLAQEIYARGVSCVTIPNSARKDPAAKTTDWLHDRRRITAAMPDGIYEGLLLSEAGDILEGLSSNFYAILGGELRTAGEGALPGISRQIVFEVASGIVPICKDAVNIRDIPRLDEAFITSSSRGIVPVVVIDGQRIGSGNPGPCTDVLSSAYKVWVAAHLEDL